MKILRWNLIERLFAFLVNMFFRSLVLIVFVCFCWLMLFVAGFSSEFRKACQEAGGQTVFDGRQNQCIRELSKTEKAE